MTDQQQTHPAALSVGLLDHVTLEMFERAWLDPEPTTIEASYQALAVLDLWMALGEAIGVEHIPDWVHAANAAMSYQARVDGGL